MGLNETVGLLIKLLIITSIFLAIWEAYRLSKRKSWKYSVRQYKDEKFNRTFILVVENISLEDAYSKCLDWLSTYQCQIIKHTKPRFINAIHRIDIHYFSFWLHNPKKHEDIPKQLEFHLRRYLLTDTEITLTVSIKSEREYVTEFDFLDLDWYKQELHEIFQDYKTHIDEAQSTR